MLNTQPVKIHGQLSVDGIHLKDEHGNNVVLRGMSLGWHNWWPRFYNTGAVHWLNQDWSCSVVRAAMGVEPKGAYIDKPTWSIEKVKAVADAALKKASMLLLIGTAIISALTKRNFFLQKWQRLMALIPI